MSNTQQLSFAGGEVSPALYARVDTAKYASGLRTCRNFQVRSEGGAENRPGTVFLATVKDSTKRARLITFVFSVGQTFTLELGDYYVRFYWINPAVPQLGSHRLQTSEGHSYNAWNNATAYKLGDLVYYGIFLTPYYCLQANTNQTPTNTTYWYPMSGNIYEIPTPWAAADLPLLKLDQSADVVTITHPSYPIYELKRYDTTTWTITPKTITPSILSPQNLVSSGTAAATTYAGYAYGTAIDATTGKILAGALLGVTTAVPTGWHVGDYVLCDFWLCRNNDNVLNAHFYGVYKVAGILSSTYFEFSARDNGYPPITGLYNPPNTTMGNFTKANSSTGVYTYVVTAIDKNTGEESYPSASCGTTTLASSTTPLELTWDASANAASYMVYKSIGGTYGFAASVQFPQFVDMGVDADYTVSPPVVGDPIYSSPDNYPSTVAYYQQRLCFANSNLNVEQIRASATGHYNNFTAHNPVQDDDALAFTISSRKVQAVKSMLDLGQLIVLTQSGEWAISGDGNGGPVTPGNIVTKQISSYGANDLPPIPIGISCLFVQARGSVVRDLAYDFLVGNYRGNDLSTYSRHLLEGHTLVDWAFQQVPHGIVWMIRDDGALLGLTYLREQQMLAWHRHDTSGIFESICSVPEGGEDAVYVIVNRNGTRCVERFATRLIEDIRDLVLTDSTGLYDGRNIDPTNTATLTTSAGWTYQDTLTLTMASYTPLQVGEEIHLWDAAGKVLRCKITVVVDTLTLKIFSVTPNRTVPADLQAVAVTNWAMAVPGMQGLNRFAGQQVCVYADGMVVANPSNPAYKPALVDSFGRVTLDRCYAVIHVGLPVTADLETLDIQSAQGQPLGEAKLIQQVKLRLDQTRGLWAGARAPQDASPQSPSLDGLRELKLPRSTDYDAPPPLFTDTIKQSVEPRWDKNGRIFLRQVDPVPVTVQSVEPWGYLSPTDGGSN